MSAKTIYIFHKNGAPSHYYGLVHLAKKNGWKVKYREFSILSKFYKGILRGNFKLAVKQITNFIFLCSLYFSKDKKVVLGIAPFDSKLKSLTQLLKNHHVYYHTSWTCWDKSFHPKRKRNTSKLFDLWKEFLENQTTHIFSVTEKSKNSILENYEIPKDKISVVYHSLHPAFETHTPEKRIPNSFIYIGRFTNDKGIDKLLEFAAQNPAATVTFVGDGKEKEIILSHSKRYTNINFEGYISDKLEIKKVLRTHQFLVLNSQKTKTWEELFGIIIIEAMSQGTLPIATNHNGPKEIIDASFGFLFEEGEITTTLARVLENESYSEEMSSNAISASKKYFEAEIAKKWRPILR